jgi:hypothetical protein
MCFTTAGTRVGFFFPGSPLPTRHRLWIGISEIPLGVQIEYDVVHLQTSLVQLFVLLQLNFKEIVQIIEQKRFRDAPNGYPSAALNPSVVHLTQHHRPYPRPPAP